MLLAVVMLGVFCVCLVPFLGSSELAANFPFLQPSISESQVDAAFATFVTDFKRDYSSSEETQLRRRIFAQNYRRIAIFNNQPRQTVTLGVNQFADLTDEEFAAQYLARPKTPPSILHKPRHPKAADLNLDIDWVKKGKVSPVKDQGICGSCWTFSSISVVETLHAIRKNSSPVRLSEQQLVDCCRTVMSNGCHGGEPPEAFDYIRKNGITLNENYPYRAEDLECKKDVPAFLKIQGYLNITPGNNTEMEKIILNQTIAVELNASPYVFRFYKSGVVDAGCPSDIINHAVTIVGAGTDENNVPYWLVRNSWSATWGDKGHLRLKRHSDGMPGPCGVALWAKYIFYN
jgi:KDEL-tailed cysteine endopeptidase